jgi:hypothetical protein
MSTKGEDKNFYSNKEESENVEGLLLSDAEQHTTSQRAFCLCCSRFFRSAVKQMELENDVLGLVSITSSIRAMNMLCIDGPVTTPSDSIQSARTRDWGDAGMK